ncbi:macrolide export ATP-binding/permease MacB [Bartonella birtlesii LL-WM9]|uniref:Pyoverdine export ATP-binding/permease protein PvdT n=1 Tax=Bartonella birtlesii LL-WM9 TaxID=1094552 RepID=J1IYQ1_9HYPH|nr:MacB family efflux pump subunit [Bartonella birtlesii]EJF76395.1 macrolide export ATP-binding/permease MacB [Bartonella birtlesii LL-WM9]
MKTEQADAVLVLENIVRTFPAGETFVTVLKDINLTIKRGEMVAIVGASGSGKSTLMNILGCLDRPTSGRYWISGKETAFLSADELSALRRNHFGFIFQRYHLLNELTALGNVEIPAIYAGCAPNVRKQRAEGLLTRLGMGDRINHRPNQLSGGQQQRVSIARALMNNAEVILADEPTGALDKQSGQEVLRILDELHQEEGRTIIIVTHDMQVAKRADRIIEISDGEIIADKLSKGAKTKTSVQPLQEQHNLKDQKILGFFRSFAERFREAFVMALLAMNAHRMRTFLTMLGVIIGIGAIIAMVALGNGTREKIMENFKSLGSNTLTILPGKSLSDPQAEKITSLVEADADALSGLPYVSGVTPQISTSSTIRFGAVEVNVIVSGVGEQYFQTQGLKAVQGQLFDQKGVHERAADLVIEKEALAVLFPHSHENPIGKVVQVGNVPVRVIGVVDPQHMGGGTSNTLQVYLPYTTLQTRFLGTTQVRAITVKVADHIDSHLAEKMVKHFLIMRHGGEDFFIRNSQFFRDRITESTHILTLLVSSIAAISLIVGGIGVMNIMLVTVSERINEIGVRMAVGARQSDILQQFLIEAILVCVIGGGVGVLFGLSIGGLFLLFKAPIHLVYTIDSIIISLTFSTLIGICFGFSPARQASRLDPVVALSRD